MGTDTPRLFDDEPAPAPRPRVLEPGARVVRVLPDRVGIDKEFDYLVPAPLADLVAVGDRVRIQLGARRAGGWITALDVEPAAGVELVALAARSGVGPSEELIELSSWAKWRWAAKSRVPFLRTASPQRVVPRVPTLRRPPARQPSATDPVLENAVASATTTVLRWPPAADWLPIVEHAGSRGPALVIAPTRSAVLRLAARARRVGLDVSVHPEDWAAGAGGGVTVIGTRAAVWARMPDLRAVVVLDEHDEAHQEQRSPTWHAREIAVERARRSAVPCLLVSPVPSLEALDAGTVVQPSRAAERGGWPVVVLVDRNEDDEARNALVSPALATVLRSGARVVAILNRKGRAALLSCRSCGELATCEACDGAMLRPADGDLRCRRCELERPVVCASCGGLQLVTVRMGVARLADDLEALAGESVLEVTADTRAGDVRRHRIIVGTEAALHRVDDADVVAFLDFDQELLAPRYRAAEQALALLARAGRLVGGRRGGGRVLVQTRVPDHEVCRAAVLGDPSHVAEAERARRELLGWPPAVAMAEVGSTGAARFVAGLPVGDAVRVRGPVDSRWHIVAEDHDTLCDALAAAPRPSDRLRLAVDPPR